MEYTVKPIKGYEGIYEADSDGSIWSIRHPRTGNRKQLKVLLNKKGYPQVRLYKNKKSSMFRTHRIIAELFIPNPDSLPQVNHKDGNKQNNSVDNLEWITNSRNVKHSFDVLGRKGLKGTGNGSCKLTESQVKSIYLSKHKYSQNRLAEIYGVSQTAIYYILTGKNWRWLTASL